MRSMKGYDMGGEIIDSGKQIAGYHAAEMIADGMTVGLGTGSTVWYAMERLAERVREGLDIRGVPTSHQARLRAHECGIPVVSLTEYPELDYAIDGADQVDPHLNLIKGRGAAHARERCVADAAKRLIIVIDESKLTGQLDGQVPVEVIPFAVPLVLRHLEKMGGNPVIREGERKDGPVITDNCNWIIDCAFGAIRNPEELEARINTLPGVVSCGIFTEFREKTTVIIGEKKGVRTLLH
jgi:ribose 5-phosphate isomerase A